MARAGTVKKEGTFMMAPWFAIDGHSYLGCFVGCYYHSDPNFSFAWLAIDLLSSQKVSNLILFCKTNDYILYQIGRFLEFHFMRKMMQLLQEPIMWK